MSFFKGRAIFWLLIPAVFVVAFLWDRESQLPPEFIQEDSNPDFYLTNTKSFAFSEEGLISKTFSSDKTLHYTTKMQTQMTNPVFSMQPENNSKTGSDDDFDNRQNINSWTVSAQSAINNELSEELKLEGNVSVALRKKASLNPIYLSMPELTIDLASQNAFTQSAVILNHELYIMTADGMNADFIHQKIDFLSNVTFKEL